MANLARVRVEWTGTPVVGSGVSTFYFDEAATGYPADLSTFFDTIKGRIPIGVTIRIPSNGDLIDVASGELTGTWSEAGGSVVVCSGTGNYAAGVGARSKWRTSGIKNGRRVVGSTFLCPLTTGAYDSDGTILAAVLSTLSGATTALVTAVGTDMKIYSRPVAGSGGQASTVVSGEVPDKVSWLRSRRT